MPTPDRCVIDDVTIDFAARQLLRGGQVQPLEPKAFGVLALLAGEPGRAFSRDEILDAVWGHRHITPGVLNRIVTLLRHALGEDAQHPRLLHTLHGIGYRFDLPHTAAEDAQAQAAGHPLRRASDHIGRVPLWRRAWVWVTLAVFLAIAATLAWRLISPRRQGEAADAPSVTATWVARPLTAASGSGAHPAL